MAEYVAVAVAGRDPGEVAAALNGHLPGKVTGVRRRTATLIVLFEPLEGTPRAAVAEAIRATAERVGRDETRVSIGAAGPRRGPAGAQTALLEAEHALAIGRALNGDGATTHFPDLGPYCFVLGRPPSEIREFVSRVLGPLATDPDRYDELTRTLETYLEAHGSLNEVARRLFLHRNTVRQRLRRIAEITRADLGDADTRLSLHLAVLGRRALGQLEAGAA